MQGVEPVDIGADDLRMTHSGFEVNCPDCTGWHLLSQYVHEGVNGTGCPHRDKPASYLLIHPTGGER